MLNIAAPRRDKESKIPGILIRSECKKHGAPTGIPCWHIPMDSGYSPAICNDRAIKAGCNAPINPESLGMRRAERPSRARKSNFQQPR